MKRFIPSVTLFGALALIAALVACAVAPTPGSDPTAVTQRVTTALSAVVEQGTNVPPIEASPRPPAPAPYVPPATSSPTVAAAALPAATTDQVKVLIPTVMKVAPALGTHFGVGITPVNESGGLSAISAAGAKWTRRFLRWSDVEPSEGARNWAAVAALEAELAEASRTGISVMLIIGDAPAWAQAIPGVRCGPVLREKFSALGAFAKDLVTRYGSQPFGVTYYEIWNEPDVSYRLVDPASEFGCWGDSNDPYYGGGYYGDMLKTVGPMIKAANPGAQVVVGGLLLDCDPVNSPAGKDCSSSKFFEGMLRGGAAPYFDGVSFHAYDFAGAAGWYGNPNWNSAWNTTGPSAKVKVKFLRDKMAAFGVTGKYLINTEVALLCWACPSVPPIFEQIKADYVAQSFAGAVADDLKANLWYNYFGWFWSGLATFPDQAKLPAYKAFQVMAAHLDNAKYVAPVTSADVGAAAVTGYKFNGVNGNLWVTWSLDNQAKTLTLPAVPTAIYDAVGAPRALGTSVPMTSSVLYIEFGPARR